MSVFEALILGIVQGLAEFLPVSSSGHLKLGQLLFGMEHLDRYILFDLICHLGTLLVILIAFWKEVVQALTEKKKMLLWVAIGTLPLFVLVPIIKSVKEVISSPHYLGFFFLFTALLLFLGERFGRVRHRDILAQNKWGHALAVGVSQALAVLPGVSRSGSTISVARLLGWEHKDAKNFSFLLAIPAILGAITLEVIGIAKDGVPDVDISLTAYCVAFVASFAAGWYALQKLIQILYHGTFKGFIYYCFAVGILTLMIVNMNG